MLLGLVLVVGMSLNADVKNNPTAFVSVVLLVGANILGISHEDVARIQADVLKFQQTFNTPALAVGELAASLLDDTVFAALKKSGLPDVTPPVLLDLAKYMTDKSLPVLTAEVITQYAASKAPQG